MRRLGLLYLVLGLVATQGCHKTLQHTAGVCDCYPPPVESLLVAPCPSDAGSSYAPAPHIALPARNAPARALPGGANLDGTVPSNTVPPKVIEKQAVDGPVTEPIRSLPTITNPK